MPMCGYPASLVMYRPHRGAVRYLRHLWPRARTGATRPSRVLLGEPLTVKMLSGIALIAAGVLLVEVGGAH